MSGGIGQVRFKSGQIRLFRFEGGCNAAEPQLFESKNEYDQYQLNEERDFDYSDYKSVDEFDDLIDAEFATNYYEDGVRWLGMASLNQKLIPSEYLSSEDNITNEGLPNWWIDPETLCEPTESETDLAYARGTIDADQGQNNQQDFKKGSEPLEAYLDGLSDGIKNKALK